VKVFGLDVRRVTVAFFLTFGILAGGRIAAYHVQVERPLEAFLSQRADVLEYRLVKTTPALEVHVRLANTRDIQSTYTHLCTGLARASGKAPWRLMVWDARTDELTGVYQRMRLAIEEGISRGTFREMANAIDEEAVGAHLDRWGVYVDSRYVYVQLHKGERYLYEVIPRQGRLPTAGDALTDPPARSGAR